MSFTFTFPTLISEQEKQEMYFYPDIFHYDLDQNQYISEWNRLKEANYLMVHEGKLYPTHIFQYYFQYFRSWFGYDNACHPDKVVLSAMKFCYFGYLNGYNQHQAVQIIETWPTNYRPTSSFLNNCQEARNNHASKNLQQKLLAFYQDHSSSFSSDLSKKRSPTHPASNLYAFGQTYASKKEWNAFVNIDPQNDSLIKSHLSDFPKNHGTLLNSTCGFLYAIHQFQEMQKQFEHLGHTQNARLKSWHQTSQKLFTLYPSIGLTYLNFILLLKSALAEVDATERLSLRQEISTLIQRHYSQSTMQSAIELHIKNKKYRLAFEFVEELEKLNSVAAVKCMEKYAAHLYIFLQPDTALSQAYAKYLVKKSNGVGTLFGWVGANKYRKKAVALDSNLAHTDCAPYCFKKHIKNSEWDKAFQLLQQRRRAKLLDCDLDIADRRTLADNFVNEGLRIYEAARVNYKRDYRQTEEKYHDSLALLACAAEVISEEKYIYHLNVHRRVCAQIILEAEKNQEYCSPERIELALGYIEAITQTPCKTIDPALIDTQLQLLEEKIHLLHQLCLDPDAVECGLNADSKHKIECAGTVKELMSTLEQAIQLWQKTPHRKPNPHYASMLFLKAECLYYFELAGDIGYHYKQACEFAPKEPYYRLRYAEFYNATNPTLYKKESTLGIQLLKQQGKNMKDYMTWFDQRWLAKSDDLTSAFVM